MLLLLLIESGTQRIGVGTRHGRELLQLLFSIGI